MATVLIVEDDELMQRMYSAGLQQEGFQVTTVASGGEALARLEETHYDLVILDMMLSGMSGLDIVKAYDFKTKSPATLIIALTNLDNPDVAERVKQAGVSAYLRKADYEPTALANYIRTLLSGQQPVK